MQLTMESSNVNESKIKNKIWIILLSQVIRVYIEIKLLASQSKV